MLFEGANASRKSLLLHYLQGRGEAYPAWVSDGEGWMMELDRLASFHTPLSPSGSQGKKPFGDLKMTRQR